MSGGEGQGPPVPYQAALFGPALPRWLSQDWPQLQVRRVIGVPEVISYLLTNELAPEAVCGPPTACEPAVRARLRALGVRFLSGVSMAPWEALSQGLNYAITTGARDIWILGIGEEGLAQTVAYLSLLARPEWGAARLTVVHGCERGYILRHGEAAHIQGHLGETVMLVPLSPTVTEVTTRGLDPSYQGHTLQFGQPLQVQLVATTAQVWIRAGCLLVSHTRQASVQPPDAR